MFSTYVFKILTNFSYLMISWSLWFVYKIVAFSFLFGIILSIQSFISLWIIWISQIVFFCYSWSKGKWVIRFKYYVNLLKSAPLVTCWETIWLFTAWLRFVDLLTTSLIANWTFCSTLIFFELIQLFKWFSMLLNFFNSSITTDKSL